MSQQVLEFKKKLFKSSLGIVQTKIDYGIITMTRSILLIANHARGSAQLILRGVPDAISY